MRKVSQKGPRTALSVAALFTALSLAPSAFAQDEEEEDELGDLDDKGTDVEDETDDDNTSATKPTPKVSVETGAPRPSAQTPGVAPPAPPPGAPPPPPTIKVGGGFILAYFHPYNMKEQATVRQFRPEPKPNFETFRAAILLDSKIDRFGVHIEFRARDKRVREFYEGTAWLEEIYGSVDILKPDSQWGPMTLKIGKSYMQFGRFWDDSFYGNVHLRDGLKLDPNYGVSLEGQLGKGKFGAKYFGQYYIIDGGTNTSLNTRDTFSVPAPASGYPPSNPIGGTLQSLGRKRNMFVGRIEPFLALSPTTVFKIAGSIQNFTADFGPTIDQQDVKRFGADITANVAWFGAWAEYTVQKGRHTLNHPFAPTPVGFNPFRAQAGVSQITEPSPAGSSDDVTYLLAGGRFFWKGIMLRYNFNMATYRNVPFPYPRMATAAVFGPGRFPLPTVDVVEKMHVPGIMITATPQLFLMIEAPIHRRFIPAPNLSNLPAAAQMSLRQPKNDLVLDQSIVVTLHARI